MAILSLVYAFGPYALCLGPREFTIVTVVFQCLLYGISFQTDDVSAVTIRQVVTPDQLQGRAITASNTISRGTLGCGPVVSVVLGERIGLLPKILVGGAACLLGEIPALVPCLLELTGSLLIAGAPPS